MYLKNLTLHGFKSFPSSVKLEFNKGITSVVGPNGSGKSNVSDAIRWVLGEQSAKNLRGGKMEDVIFFGTQNRKSVGYCEVTMVLSNEDRLLPLDFDEISITRRQTRNGESLYKINDVTARLKDVLSLFMDTGIGKEGYSIIGQGKIEEILKSKSDERRLLFEEATGIVKYKSRKKEAETKLSREKENLVRINDILKELEIQLEPLRIQSEKAKKYLSLYEQKKSYHIALFLLDIEEKEKTSKQLLDKIETFKKDIYKKTEDYNKIEETIERFKNENITLSATIKETEQRLSLEKEYFLTFKHDINLLNEKLSVSKENENRLKSEANKKIDEIDFIESDILDLENNISRIDDEIKSLDESFLSHKNLMEEISKNLTDTDETFKNINDNIINNAKEISKVTSNIESEESLYEALSLSAEQIIEVINTLEEEIKTDSLNKIFYEKSLEKASLDLKNLKSKIDDFEESSREIKEKRLILYKKRDELNSSFQQKNAKYLSLKNAEKNHLGYYDSVKFILSKKEENDPRFAGVFGTVGDIFSTIEKYETALSIAISGSVQNIVTTDEEVSKNIINILRAENKGRATFLPLTNVKTYSDIDNSFLNENGVIGYLKDLVTYDEKFSKIANSLLQKTLVIDTLENAILFNKKYKNKIRIVTLKGDILSTTGSLSGGSVKNQSSIFQNKRLIKEFEKEVEIIKEDLNNANNELSSAEDKAQNIKEEMTYIRSSIVEIQQDENKYKELFSNISIKLQYKNEELSKALTKKESIFTEIENKNIFIREQYNLLETLKIEADSLKKAHDDYTENLSSNNTEKEKSQEILMTISVKNSKLTEEKRNIVQNVAKLRNNITTLKDEISSIEKSINSEINNISSISDNIYTTEKNISEKDSIIKSLEESIKKNESILAEKSENQSVLDTQNKERYKEISSLRETLSKDEIYLSSTEEIIAKLYDDIWNEYELTLSVCKEFPKIEKSYYDIKSTFAKLSSELKSLGVVNVASIAQYDEVKKRYDFINEQRNDIINGEKKLNTIIKDLTTLMEEQFLSQFEIINENFKEVFVKMFSGGKADLVLSDKSDPLNSQIDIYAEPPGKKLKNLMLMSGGEKSLTAICLLFGILKMKPSPFCVLDEIEAALDDANVDRYAEFLKDFSKETQFILITHRKGTMVIADTLYGVTMEELGVSKLVSVKLTDYE